jgi:tetratricopeptide (TPR) repeat protein
LFISRECQKISVVGLGGVGKTQVVLKFAYHVKETRPEFSVFWLPALSMETFEQACADIAKELRLGRPGDEDPKELVRQHLRSKRAGPWLLVVDNADDREIMFGCEQASAERSQGIVDYLPESEHGLTVFTTRDQSVAVSLTRSEVIQLREISSHEGFDLLKRSLINKTLTRATADELLDELGHLPLAITQAVAYMNSTNVSISEYLRLLRNTEEDTVSLMSREFRDDSRYNSSAHSVATTFVVSFSQITKFDPLAAEFLSFISCIEWKAIPRSILPVAESEEQKTHAIGTLCAFSLLVARDDESTYDVHRLVHLATRIWIYRRGHGPGVMQHAIQHVAQAFPSSDYENRLIWRAYLPHAFRLLIINEIRDIEAQSKLYQRVGMCLTFDGRPREAVTWLENATQLRYHLPEDDPYRLSSEHELAVAYRNNGQVKVALELLEHVVAIREKVLEENHPHRLASQHVLATACIDDGQVKKAVELLEHVVAIKENSQEENHPHRLASQHVLAGAYIQDGQVKKAVELLEHVVAIDSSLEENHPDRLASQHAIAGAYIQDGQVKKAVELLEHVVAIKSSLEENHPGRLLSQAQLALAYIQDRQIKRGVILLQHVVSVGQTTFRDGHPTLLSFQRELANVSASEYGRKKDESDEDESGENEEEEEFVEERKDEGERRRKSRWFVDKMRRWKGKKTSYHGSEQ